MPFPVTVSHDFDHVTLDFYHKTFSVKKHCNCSGTNAGSKAVWTNEFMYVRLRIHCRFDFVCIAFPRHRPSKHKHQTSQEVQISHDTDLQNTNTRHPRSIHPMGDKFPMSPTFKIRTPDIPGACIPWVANFPCHRPSKPDIPEAYIPGGSNFPWHQPSKYKHQTSHKG